MKNKAFAAEEPAKSLELAVNLDVARAGEERTGLQEQVTPGFQVE